MTLAYDDLIERRSEPRAYSYTDTQMLLYNISVGMGRDPTDPRELGYIYEKPELRVVPTAAAVLLSGDSSLLGNAPIDWARVLHGEQRIAFHRPIPPSGDLVSSSHISEVVDKGPDKGAIITVTVECALAGGEPLFTMDNVIFARGNGGLGGPEKSRHTPHALPERAPDMRFVTETRRDQAALYRLTGDRNPLHIDPAYAKRAGFPAPILHGLASYGITCRALLASVCDYDPARMKSFDCRFTSPVFPGETLESDIWVDGDIASFRVRVAERDVVALNNGRCLITN
ncbi:MaoC family dehydratase [Novosphingobium pentaromativorans]|uniref:MaoC-like dehydratase n=1 Tax=Novosphingobium pentaromativorans US6-1 TaxID=1088721 RepID=G6EDB0_9SPHN|nr:MaoC family dehydratase [Novosphingobium pentaromativorans]AIT79804.1 3-alpha,7-alpha,12-alpha-trihydroxy-5-beta-cholest-24-enoyl-CoA hydratase [Novosphingobium pentaromativorans US6-1]EHJ60709.1 hypothetical protein NSU_2331 [Novosphingobium pentaromativorans US6-1]